MRILWIFSFIFIFFISCSSKDPQQAFIEKDFSKDFSKLVRPFCRKAHFKSVILTDILDYRTLKPTPDSLYLTEHLRVALTNTCKTKVYQIETNKKIVINNSGVIGLSRDITKIKNKKINSRYLITGTYAKTDTYVTVFLRLIDIKSGKIIKTSSKKIRYKYISNPFTDDPFDI